MDGMTDFQFKAFLRGRLGLEESVMEKLKEGKTEDAIKMLERIIQTTKDSIADL